jgi:hypothetical protein
VRVTDLDTSAYPECITGTPTESGSGRSVGTLHLSTVYRSMEEDALIAKKREATPDDLMWYAAGGFLWERVFAQAHREAVLSGTLVRPDEWSLDGICGSPDHIDIETWRIIELKCRWMSAQKFEQLEKHFWLEIVQIKGYCKLIGATEAELWVFFVAGNWRPPVPMVGAKLLEFSQQEIDENWDVIVQHARRKGWL